MANAFQTIQNGLAELKNYYQGPIVDLMSEQIPVYRAAEKVKQGWSGYQVIRPLRTVRNPGVGATSDGGILPLVGRQSTVQAIIAAKFNYLRFGVTGPMIKASQSDIGSFVRSAAYELEMGYNDLRTDVNRQLCWDGTNTLATVNTASNASTTLIIGGRTTAEPALKYIDVGSVVDVMSGSTVISSGVTVLSITTGTPAGATATIVLDQAITTLTTYTLVRTQSTSNEIQGLFYALDGGTTSIYSVARTTNLAFQGNSTDASTLASSILSIDLMQNPFNEGLRRGNVGKYNAIYTDFNTLRYYQKLLTPDKRYSNSVEGDGTFGNKGTFYLEFNGIAVVPDKDMPTRIAMLPAEVLKLYVLAEMEFADESGSMYIPQSDQDALEVRLRFFANLFNEQPAACAVLKGYTTP